MLSNLLRLLALLILALVGLFMLCVPVSKAHADTHEQSGGSQILDGPGPRQVQPSDFPKKGLHFFVGTDGEKHL